MSFLFFAEKRRHPRREGRKLRKKPRRGVFRFGSDPFAPEAETWAPAGPQGRMGRTSVRMSFLFFVEKRRHPRREGAAVFCGNIPLGCCFSFLLALFI